MKDKSFFKFLGVGLINTGISTVLMLVLHNWLGFGYWGSSAPAFAVGAVVSYFLNRRFTFRSTAPARQTVWRFALNVAVCYGVAFFLAQPAAEWLLAGWRYQEQAALLLGQGLYVMLNYLGQRFFAFARSD